MCLGLLLLFIVVYRINVELLSVCFGVYRVQVAYIAKIFHQKIYKSLYWSSGSIHSFDILGLLRTYHSDRGVNLRFYNFLGVNFKDIEKIVFLDNFCVCVKNLSQYTQLV